MKLKNQIIALTIFSIAMGLLEAAVVIYLRKLYYSQGFEFPLNTISDSVISITELLRELATLIMLVGIAYLFGRNFLSRMGAFLISFAIWDIFYYVFLKLLLGWPESFFTWDVLFLLPLPWIGPVLAPIIVSLTMILLGSILISHSKDNIDFRFQIIDWMIFISSSILILISFMIDSAQFMLSNNTLAGIFKMNFDQLFVLLQNYFPRSFRWWIFILGEIGLLSGIINLWIRVYKKKNYEYLK